LGEEQRNCYLTQTAISISSISVRAANDDTNNDNELSVDDGALALVGGVYGAGLGDALATTAGVVAGDGVGALVVVAGAASAATCCGIGAGATAGDGSGATAGDNGGLGSVEMSANNDTSPYPMRSSSFTNNDNS
jgi:hypothetical protein